jgi:hypothetical protein
MYSVIDFVLEPSDATKPGDAIQKILNSVGVEYSHANEMLLKPSTVENKVTEDAIKARCYPLNFLSNGR